MIVTCASFQEKGGNFCVNVACSVSLLAGVVSNFCAKAFDKASCSPLLAVGSYPVGNPRHG